MLAKENHLEGLSAAHHLMVEDWEKHKQMNITVIIGLHMYETFLNYYQHLFTSSNWLSSRTYRGNQFGEKFWSQHTGLSVFYNKLQGAKSPPTQTYILLLSSEHKDAGDDRSSTWSCKVQLGRWSTRLTSALYKHLNNISLTLDQRWASVADVDPVLIKR